MTRSILLGKLKIGGSAPVRIKAMLKSKSTDTAKVIEEALTLKNEGAEAIRLAVKDDLDLALAPMIKRRVDIPLVADIHFHYKMALSAIAAGFEGVRLNPMNITKQREIDEVIRAAKKNKVSIRVGVNSGGFRERFATSEGLAQAMVKACAQYIKIIEKHDFYNISVSLKASDVATTIQANEFFAKKYDYPLHLGVTATGPFLEGTVKSSVALGELLQRGIGSIIRVSLTAPSFWEVRVAKYILQACNVRVFGPQIVSCPTCSRCQVDLITLVDKFKAEIEAKGFSQPLHIALMGCVVNGPGEARQADIGVAFGNKKAAIFKGDKILRWSHEDTVVSDLLGEVDTLQSRASKKRG